MMKKRLLAMSLILSMIVSLLPATVLAAEGTPDTPDTPYCDIEGSDGSYNGYNWMGVTPTVGDKDVYVHIVGTVPDGWTMVGGKWTGADYIDTDSNRLLNKADCENLFTKSLTQTGKVSVGQNAYKKDVTIYHLTVDDDGALEDEEYRIFFEGADQYYVPSHYNIPISDGSSLRDNADVEMELPQEISPETTSVSFSCTVNLYGENPNDATFYLRQGGVNGTPVGSVSGRALQQSQRTGGSYEFRGTMPVSGLTGGTDLYLSFSHYKFNEAEWYSGPTTYVVPDGRAGQFILYGAEKDTTDDAGYERRHSTYEKAVPGATYCLTDNGDTTHTFVISGSSLSDVSKLSVTGGSLVADSLSVSMKNGVYTVTGGVTVNASASVLSFSYDGNELHSINLDRTKLAGVTDPYVTGTELVQAYENGDFTVKLSGFNLGSDAEGYSGINYAGEEYTCESLTERNGLYTLRFKPSGTYSDSSVTLQYNGQDLEMPDEYSNEGGMMSVSVWVDYPNRAEFSVPDGVTEYVGAVRGNQTLTIMGVGFDDSQSYTACFVPHTSEGFDEVKTVACAFVSEKELTANAASVGTGWYTVYITAGNEIIPRFHDIALYEDVSAPQLPVIIVNGGKGVTTSQTIELSIDGGDYTKVRVAESTAELASAAWQPVDSLTSYTLSEGYGEKTLYFEFRTAENEIYSETARVMYSDTALSGAEYGISGADADNIVYPDSKYTLFIQYTGTGYVKGQAEICDENGSVRETVELRRVSTVGTTATYTGKAYFASTDKQILFSLIDESGNAVSADPMAVTVEANALVISAANAPQVPRGSDDQNRDRIGYTANYTLEFNGTPGKKATAVFAFDDAVKPMKVPLSETESNSGHYLFNGAVSFPEEAKTLRSITYHLTGTSNDTPAEMTFTADKSGTAYTEFVLSPALTITNIPEWYQYTYTYLVISANTPGSNFTNTRVIDGTDATFKYLDNGATYGFKIVMDGIVMRSWEVEVNGDTTFDYAAGEPVGTAEITMDITPPEGANWYVDCVYTAADETAFQFSLPCNGKKTLPKQGSLSYEVRMSSEEKLKYRPMTGTVELSADRQTITATPEERPFRTITGNVMSKLILSDVNETAIPLNGAAVQVTQSLTDDPYACIVNHATTDIEGNYSVSVCDDFPVTITFSRFDHETIPKKMPNVTAASADAWNVTMQYAIKNIIIPRLVVTPIEDPDFGEDQSLQPVELTTDQLSLREMKTASAAYYQNTFWLNNNVVRSVVALTPGTGSSTESACPNQSIQLQFQISDERLVLDNDGKITVTTDERSTAVANLTAVYRGYLRLNALEEANTIYMLVYDKAKYNAGSGDAYVGMVYGNGLVTTEELKLDAGEYKIFVFKGSDLVNSISALASVNTLQQYLKDGILHDENCKQIDAVVENGKITPLEKAIPAKALTGDALCSIQFVTEQTENGDLRVKFYVEKVPEGQRIYYIALEQSTPPVNPANPLEKLKDIIYYTGFGQDELPSGEFYLGRDPYTNKAEGFLNVGYNSSYSSYTIRFKISEELPSPHISLEMSPVFSTTKGKIDISGQTEPNKDVTLQIGGLNAGTVKSDARGHYAATLQVTGAENGSVYPVTAAVEADEVTWTAQSRVTASTNIIEVLNIQIRSALQPATVIRIDNPYSHHQANSQALPYSPYMPSTVNFQLTGCKKDAFASVWLITYDQNGYEDKAFRATCTGVDASGYTTDWEIEGELGYYSGMGLRYFFNPDAIEDDLYELLTGNELADLTGLLNAANAENPSLNTINLTEAPNVIRRNADESNFQIYGAISSQSASSFAYTRPLSGEEEDDEAADTSFAYKQNLGGEGDDAGQLDANVSMAEPMTEAELEAAGYLKMDTKQGSVWIKQEVEGDEETGITYKRSMYFSPEISEAAGITSPAATTFAARSTTDRVLEGIDCIGNFQGSADFLHSLNGEMAEQFSKTALGSSAVGTGIAILSTAGTVVKIISGPSGDSPDKLMQMVKLIKNPDTRKTLMLEIQDYIELSNDLYYTDCIGSSLLSGIGFYSNATPLIKGTTLIGGIAFGAINGWTGDELKAMYASIERSIIAELERQGYRIGRNVKFPDFKLLIDPSGYVFEAVEDNRVEGVTATVFEVDLSGNATAWTDHWTGQENPQTTGNDGRYGWDVPTGTWKVSFDKEGYQHAESKTMTVYPAHTEVNIGLLSTAVPEVTAAAIVDNDELEVQFSMYMQADASSCAITVYDEDMQIVPGTVSFPKAVLNTGYKDGDYQRDAIAADQFTRWATFTPSEDYVGGFHDGETYTVKVSKNALSYAGVPMAADYINAEVCKSETVITLAVPTANVTSGVFKNAQTITLTAENDASIFYTTDGSTPNENSTIYTGPITLSSNTTLKFIAVKTGYNNSPVGEETYVIELSGKASKPTANVTSGTYSDTLSVTLSSKTPGAKIHYTLDGSEPTASSVEYVSPISISATTTLKAIAVIDGLDNSDVSTFEYRISSGNSGGGSSGGSGGGNSGGNSGGSGGGSSGGSSNVSNSDTSTTVTPSATTKGDTASATISSSIGSSIVNQAAMNGSQTVVIAPEVKGGVTKVEVSIPASTMGDLGSKTDADLTISTPVADVTIPNGGLPGLAGRGGNVTVTAEKNGSTVELTVTAGGTTVDNVTGGVTLTVPYHNVVPSTVAVLVKKDGTREVIRKSVADKGEVRIPLSGSATVEIIDNRKVFTDTDGHWAGDAIAFVTAHELYAGTSATTFEPDIPMSRGMLARVLHNMESNPSHTFTGTFSDLNGHWATDSILWAAGRGIVGGYPNGTYCPDDAISREQLAFMLWRYSGSPMTNHSLNHFTDVNSISSYARTALAWANENGIVGGIGNHVLDPKGKATRAQVASMLMRMMLNT